MAQTDSFTGTWEWSGADSFQQPANKLIVEIGSPERGHLYPAQITIQHPPFSGTYRFLLVKRSDNTLAIGRNKVPEMETPFSIGAWTVLLNGYFHLHNRNGSSHLTIERFPSKKYGVPMPAISHFGAENQTTAIRVREFLQFAPLQLTRKTAIPWQDNRMEEILQPHLSENYYGIMDSIHVHTNEGFVRISDDTKLDDDTVSVMLNNEILMDTWPVSDHSPMEIKLDTGLNILSFFAENYGKIPPSSGSLQVKIGTENFKILYSNKADISSTVIVTKIYYYPILPPPPVLNSKLTEALMRNVKSKDSITTPNPEITLAIWDDAVQDGDSISLFVNGDWLLQGMLVTIQPKFLTVKLKPGPNDIIFIADNLGAISPNTSILEIIDKKRRKAFHINTNLRENNLVRITYIPSDP